MLRRQLAVALLAIAAATPAGAQQPIDTMYTRILREISPTDARWKLTTELVDYLPASTTVPTPLAADRLCARHRGAIE